jgi:hypothetical protein
VTRAFLSPAERRVLASLPPKEAIFVKKCMDVFDAVLVEEEGGRRPALIREDHPVGRTKGAIGTPSSTSTAGKQ